jgi:hypothetical protein
MGWAEPALVQYEMKHKRWTSVHIDMLIKYIDKLIDYQW